MKNKWEVTFIITYYEYNYQYENKTTNLQTKLCYLNLDENEIVSLKVKTEVSGFIVFILTTHTFLADILRVMSSPT